MAKLYLAAWYSVSEFAVGKQHVSGFFSVSLMPRVFLAGYNLDVDQLAVVGCAIVWIPVCNCDMLVTVIIAAWLT